MPPPTGVEGVKRQAQGLTEFPSGPLAGKRVMISADGGRTKTRRPHIRGRRTKNGRRGFGPWWRGPRRLYIALLDENGRPHPDHTPWLDASICDADRLVELGAAHAAEVVVVADDATWVAP